MEDLGKLSWRSAGRLLAAIAVSMAALIFAGCGSSASSEDASPELQAALSAYQEYLRENVAELSDRLDRLAEKIEKETNVENVPGAEAAYSVARVPYGHIDAFAQLHPPLQRAIDGLEEEVPPDQYGGFHEIEKWVFWQKVTTTMGPFAKQLSADVEDLGKRIEADELQPAPVIVGARKVADGIVANVFPGDAERWSHMDLVDAAAKTEGAEEAFKAVKPLLEEENPELTEQVEAQFRNALDAVGEYGTLARDDDPSEPLRAGTSFVVYDQVTQDKRWQLAEPFKELADLLAQAEAELDS